jgi:hypothetical protein
MTVVHRDADHRSERADVCSICGEAMTPADRTYERKWVS